jgi:hypothetical protein
MPVKRRQGKRRVGDAAEVEAWAELFGYGYDFFGELEPFGFPGGDACRAARAAAPDAWQRLGTTYLETVWADRNKAPGQRQTPWAVEEFGYPEGYTDAG